MPMLPRHSYSLMAMFALVAVMGGWYLKDVYQPTLLQSEAQQAAHTQVLSWQLSSHTEPRFYSLRGDEILTGEVSSEPAGPYLHVTFLAENYQDAEKFRDDAEGFARFLVSQTPLRERTKNIMFHLVDELRALQELREAGIPADRAVVLSDQGTSAPPRAVMYDVASQEVMAYYEAEQ